MNWKDMWEQAAHQEAADYEAMSAEELLARVKSGAWGSYWSLWPAVKAKVPLSEAAWPLYEVIEKSTLDLTRYHAAAALAALLELPAGSKIIAEAGTEKFKAQALAEFAQLIKAKLNE